MPVNKSYTKRSAKRSAVILTAGGCGSDIANAHQDAYFGQSHVSEVQPLKQLAQKLTGSVFNLPSGRNTYLLTIVNLMPKLIQASGEHSN